MDAVSERRNALTTSRTNTSRFAMLLRSRPVFGTSRRKRDRVSSIGMTLSTTAADAPGGWAAPADLGESPRHAPNQMARSAAEHIRWTFLQSVWCITIVRRVIRGNDESLM